MPNWPSIVHFYLRKLEFAPFYREITKRESKSFSWILEYSLMPIIVPKQILLMSLYFGENLPNCPSIVHFYLRKLVICTILSENHQEGEQIIFLNIRVLLNANNRTETDFSDEPLFSRKSSSIDHLSYISHLRKLEICTIFIGKSPRGRENHFDRY